MNQNIQVNPNMEIKVILTVEQVNIILTGLAELPLKVSGSTFDSLKRETERQIEESAKPVEAPASGD